MAVAPFFAVETALLILDLVRWPGDGLLENVSLQGLDGGAVFVPRGGAHRITNAPHLPGVLPTANTNKQVKPHDGFFNHPDSASSSLATKRAVSSHLTL